MPGRPVCVCGRHKTMGTVRESIRNIQTVRRWWRRAGRARSRLLGKPDAWVDLPALCRRIRPAAVLDLGAHVGRITERFADELSDVPIHAFEPTPHSAAALRQRVARLRNVTVHEIALADRSGVLPLFLNRFDATNSLLENAHGPGSPQDELYEHVGRIEVCVTTLDDWCTAQLPTGDLVIKADLQGCEGRMLAGACRVLRDGRVAALYSEVLFAPMYEGQASFWDLHETLTTRHGLALWQIYPLHRDPIGRVIWSDALWLREDVLALMRR
jgi:FkbM family methyltransferase